MMLTAIFLMFTLGCPANATAADNPPVRPVAIRKTPTKPMTLDVLVKMALGKGLRNRVPGAIAELIDVPPDTPVHLLLAEAEQTNDKMAHTLSVMVEVIPETKDVKPVGLVLDTAHILPGNTERYTFRASLDGILSKAVAIHAKRDDQNRSIKGSGTTEELDIDSPAVKKRFQHEFDFWLKKTYLKKEWRFAEFSDGVLKKKVPR